MGNCMNKKPNTLYLATAPPVNDNKIDNNIQLINDLKRERYYLFGCCLCAQKDIYNSHVVHDYNSKNLPPNPKFLTIEC